MNKVVVVGARQDDDDLLVDLKPVEYRAFDAHRLPAVDDLSCLTKEPQRSAGVVRNEILEDSNAVLL